MRPVDDMATNAPMMEKASAGVRDILSAFSSSEARYFDEERYSEGEIRKALLDNLTDRKIDAMKRLLAAVSVGRDASALFPDVVKNVSFQSVELKKLIYIYLVQYAENNRDLALLSINSFQKDMTDRSQLIRASALRAMSSIKVLEVIQLVMVAVKTAAHDSSAYVRKTAAQCMTKVYAVDPDQFLELRGLLLKLMNDNEVQVVGSAVMAFRHVCVVQPPKANTEASSGESSGGASGSDAVLRPQLELLHPHFRRLCQEILLMDSWAQQSCVDLLVRYARLFFTCPDKATASSDSAVAASSQSEDFLLLLRTLKLLLSSSSKGVTLAAGVALCYLASAQDMATVAMPLLRCLKQAAPGNLHTLLTAMLPLVKARPELFRPHIREFFVQSFDFPWVKQQKLKALELLADETNVQMVLRELQVYISWHSLPEFVTLAVQSIAHIGIKIPMVTDSCLRGLVKMLDSKCEALACEAVVSLRALLQRRHQKEESGLGTVLPHLVRYLQDLKAPTARASVVWIIGTYQKEVQRLAPDVVRSLTQTFAAERPEVKQQALILAVKVWAFHLMNSKGQASEASKVSIAAASTAGGSKATSPTVSPEESNVLLPRLEAILDHLINLASFDAAWDVRDTARLLKRLKQATQAALAAGSDASDHLGALGVWYCRGWVDGQPALDVAGVDPVAIVDSSKDEEAGAKAIDSAWIMGSLAQALDFALDTYQPLPDWATESSPDELRRIKVETVKAMDAPKSFSSATVGNIQHMETRVQVASNIKNLPVVTSLEELDLFYSEVGPSIAASSAAAASALRPSATPVVRPGQEAITLEQMRLGLNVAPVGTAVFGEDDESDEEDDDDDDWKYCQQAAVSSSSPAGVTTAAPPPTAASETPAVEIAAIAPTAPAVPPVALDAAVNIDILVPPAVVEPAEAIPSSQPSVAVTLPSEGPSEVSQVQALPPLPEPPDLL